AQRARPAERSGATPKREPESGKIRPAGRSDREAGCRERSEPGLRNAVEQRRSGSRRARPAKRSGAPPNREESGAETTERQRSEGVPGVQGAGLRNAVESAGARGRRPSARSAPQSQSLPRRSDDGNQGQGTFIPRHRQAERKEAMRVSR